MADPIQESLEFDISAALTGIQTVSDALTQAVTDFGVGLSQALETLTSVGASVTPLTETLDVAGLGPAIDTAIVDATSQPQTVTIDGDPAGLTASIDEATAVSPIVEVGADTTTAQGEIDSLNATPVTVEVDADTSQAQNSLDDLSSAATGATGGRGGGGLAGLEGAVLGVQAATGTAQGEVGGLTGAIGGMSAGLGAAVAGGAAFTAFLGKTVSLAADAQAQQNRFNAVFGQSAEIVKSINVGGLTTDLETLGRQSGTTTADLESSASRIGALGAASKAAQPEVAKTASDLLGLAGALSVANPRLGDTATVADTISRALATGRTRSLIPYGISVSQVAIQQKALHDNIGSTTATLTGYEKLVAGLTLALDQQGNTLGTKYADGIKGAEIQLRAFKVALEETLVSIGGPLLQPVTDSLSALLPVAQQVGIVLGDVGRIALPLLAGIAPLLAPVAGVLTLVSDGLSGIADVVGQIPAPLITVAVGIGVVTVAAQTVVPALIAMAEAGALSMGPVGWITLGVAVLATLGGAFDLFGGKTKQAKADTSALDNAFSTTGTSANNLSDIVGGLNKSIDDYLKKALASGDAGKNGIATANQLGVSYREISTAIGGTSQQFDHFIAQTSFSETAITNADDRYGKFVTTLQEARGTLDDNARAALDSAVASGLLAKDTLAAAEAAHHARQEHDDYGHAILDNISILRELAPAIDAAANRTNASALAAAQASPAYAALVSQLASGAITVTTFANSLATFGFTADTAGTFAKNLQSAIQGIVTTSVGALPAAKDAISTYASTVKSDLSAVDSAVKSHKGSVHDLFATLIIDSDPSKFTDNLLKQAQAINDFTANLAKISVVAPELAIQLGQAGPVAAGQLAAGFASAPAKAAAGEGALSLVDAVTTKFDAGVTERAAQFEASGAKGATSVLAGLATTIEADTSVGDATAAAAIRASARFDPSFSHRVDVAMQAAAIALGADTSVTEKAGQAGLQAVAAFEASFGPVTTAQAARIALAGAHDALTTDQTLPTASGGAGDKTAAGFKPNFKSGAQAGIASGTAAFGDLTQIGKLTTAAGTLGHSVGVGFDAGVAEGLREPKSVADVTTAAGQLAQAIPANLRRLLGIKSPSTVGITIGQEFVEGITLGLGDTTGIASAGANLAVTVSNSAALSSLGASVTSSVVAGFNDPATVDAAVKTLQALVAKAAKNAAATAAATAAQSFASGIVSGLPNAGTAISTLSQQVTQAASTQTAAFNAVHAAYQKYADDLRHKAPTATLGADLQTIATTAKDLGTAQQALAVASNPAEFVKNLRAQTAANEAFQQNLRTLISRGDVDLARQLEQAGPAAAGKLAASLASKPALAKAAEAAVDQANAFSKSYQTFLEKQFAPQVHALAGKIGTQTGQALNAGISVNGVPIAQSVSVAGPSSKTDAQAAALNAAGASQTLNLDLAIELPDGTILNSKQTVKVPMTAQEITRIKSRTKAAVIA